MLQRRQTSGQIAVLLLLLCVPAAAAERSDSGATTGLKPAITESPIRAGRSVQLGAWRTEAEARTAWTGIKERAGHLLFGILPVIVPVDFAEKGRYYRLRVTQPDSTSATHLCTALKAKRLACVVEPD